MHTYIITLTTGKQFTVISPDTADQVKKSIEIVRCMGLVKIIAEQHAQRI